MVACPPRGDLGQGAGWGLVPRLEDAPEDPVDGVVPAGEGALWSGGGSFRVSGPAYTCVRVVGMAQIQGSAPAERKRRLIHWDRQSMASPRW